MFRRGRVWFAWAPFDLSARTRGSAWAVVTEFCSRHRHSITRAMIAALCCRNLSISIAILRDRLFRRLRWWRTTRRSGSLGAASIAIYKIVLEIELIP